MGQRVRRCATVGGRHPVARVCARALESDVEDNAGVQQKEVAIASSVKKFFFTLPCSCDREHPHSGDRCGDLWRKASCTQDALHGVGRRAFRIAQCIASILPRGSSKTQCKSRKTVSTAQPNTSFFFWS